MNEITFEDMLIHYESKVTELTDEITDVRNQFKRAIETAQISWRGRAAEAFEEKTMQMLAELTKADGLLSDVMTIIVAIKNAVLSPVDPLV